MLWRFTEKKTQQIKKRTTKIEKTTTILTIQQQKNISNKNNKNITNKSTISNNQKNFVPDALVFVVGVVGDASVGEKVDGRHGRHGACKHRVCEEEELQSYRTVLSNILLFNGLYDKAFNSTK